MKDPRSARDLAAALLLATECGSGWVRDGLPAAREGLIDVRDKALVTELAYGVQRRLGTLDAILQAFSKRPLSKLDPAVLVALRIALYQVLFLDRVPVHAAVDHAVGWARARKGQGAGGFTNGVLRSVARAVEGRAAGAEQPRRDVPREDGSAIRLSRDVFPDPDADLVGNLADRLSHPRWLVERWLERRGEGRTRALCGVGIQRPPLSLRARGDRDALVGELRAAGLEARSSPVPSAILVEGAGEGGAILFVERGDAWVQDATAQRAALLLAPRPGQRLLDLCAAPGGKTLHLADLLGGRGEIVACDVDAKKVQGLAELQQRVRGDVVVESRLIDREGPLPFEERSFDGILIDAPCTNTGVLRRRVEVRWRLEPKDIDALATIQRDLLERALPLLKRDGSLVYTTCSMEPEENADLVKAFAEAHPEVRVASAVETPASRGADGGFAAVFRLVDGCTQGIADE